MACTSPLLAWRLQDGSVVFNVKSGQGDSLSLPCGQCMGCRLERSRQWAVRCVHESRMHDRNCFVTLTYSDEFLPENFNLRYRDFQLFMKRLRKRFNFPVRFYMCGEYGEKFSRPHYHACLFGLDFDDRIPSHKGESGFMVYTSELLASLWPLGQAWIGDLTFESAAYTSRYITKKLMGDAAKALEGLVNTETGEIFDRVPEFTRMSLKPGIGRPFYEKYLSDIFPHDRVVIRGAVSKPPRYYAKMYARSNPDEWEEISYRRVLSSVPSENSEERLKARDIVLRARVGFLKRSVF